MTLVLGTNALGLKNLRKYRKFGRPKYCTPFVYIIITGASTEGDLREMLIDLDLATLPKGMLS